jgi:serine protease Do
MREKLLWLAVAAALVAPGAQAQSGKVKTVSLPDAQISLVQGANGGYLGVYLADVKSEERAKELKLAEVRGAVVGKVVGGSPAAKAGLKENDVILKFDDEVIRSAAHVHRLLVETPPGRNVALRISRNGAEQTVNVTLGERSFEHIGQGILRPELGTSPGDGQITPDKLREDLDRLRNGFANPGLVYDLDASRYRLGVRVAPLSEQLANYFGVKGDGGLLVTEVEAGGLAASAGLKAGDCITAVNGERVTTASELSGAMRRAGKAAAKEQGKEAESVTLTVVRDRKEQMVRVKPEERKQ